MGQRLGLKILITLGLGATPWLHAAEPDYASLSDEAKEALAFQLPSSSDPRTARLLEDANASFAPHVFTSADEFIAYYRPNRVPGFSREGMHWMYQQYVAIVLFDSLRWSLPQFFQLKPSPKQIRELNLLPRDFARGQLHEFPSGYSVQAALLAIALRARNILGPKSAEWATAMDYKAQSASEFESLQRHVLRGDWDWIQAASKDMLNALDKRSPAPKAFRDVVENQIPALSLTRRMIGVCQGLLNRLR